MARLSKSHPAGLPQRSKFPQLCTILALHTPRWKGLKLDNPLKCNHSSEKALWKVEQSGYDSRPATLHILEDMLQLSRLRPSRSVQYKTEVLASSGASIVAPGDGNAFRSPVGGATAMTCASGQQGLHPCQTSSTQL